MQIPKIVLFNGPPRVGKDTAAHLARESFEAGGAVTQIVKFAKELKLRSHAVIGAYVQVVPYEGGVRLETCGRDAPRARVAPADFFEADKDVPLPAFRGKTPRETYIGLSEKYFKPMYGDEIFGDLLLEGDIAANPVTDTFLISDSGFESEVRPLLRRFGADRIKLVRIRREGCDFRKDSRGYLDLGAHGIEAFDLHNPAPIESNDPVHLEAFRDRIATLLDQIVPQPAAALTP